MENLPKHDMFKSNKQTKKRGVPKVTRGPEAIEQDHYAIMWTWPDFGSWVIFSELFVWDAHLLWL